MHKRPLTKRVNDSPPARGGPSLWLGLAAAAMLAGIIWHTAQPVDVMKNERAVTPAPAPREAVSHQSDLEPAFKDPQVDRFAAFARNFETETDPQIRENMMAAWLADVRGDDVPAMLTFLQSATPAELAQDLSKRLIRRWADTTPEKASTWIGTLPLDRQTVLLDDVAIVWANNNPTNAMNWAWALAGDTRRNQALASVAGEVIRSQPVLALKIALDLPASSQRDDLIRRGAMQWASEDAGDAVAWAKQIPTSDLRNQTLGGIAIVWSVSEPAAAATLALDELPPGRLLDDTVISIVQRWAQIDPEATWAWVKQFPESPLRETALNELENNQSNRQILTAQVLR